MKYNKTKNIPRRQERLDLRSVTNTMIYLHLVNFESDEYHVRNAKNKRR